MSLRHVANVVGLLLVFVAVAMAVAGLVSWFYSDGVTGAFFLSALITLVVGLAAYGLTTVSHDITIREGYAIVTFAWTAMGLFGALAVTLGCVRRARIPRRSPPQHQPMPERRLRLQNQPWRLLRNQPGARLRNQLPRSPAPDAASSSG